MKLKILLLIGAFAFAAKANPIAIFDLNTFPMTMENVTVILHDSYATVDGTYGLLNIVDRVQRQNG